MPSPKKLGKMAVSQNPGSDVGWAVDAYSRSYDGLREAFYSGVQFRKSYGGAEVFYDPRSGIVSIERNGVGTMILHLSGNRVEYVDHPQIIIMEIMDFLTMQ